MTLPKDTVVLHHSDIPTMIRQEDAIIRQHQKKFGQKGAYHYLVNKDGSVYQFHDEEFIGHHAGNWLVNVRSIGICLAGDLTREVPTLLQRAALGALVTDIQTRWGIPDTRILHHRDVKPTACPAYDLKAVVIDEQLKNLREKAGRIQGALEHVTGDRKNRLTRLLARILKLVAPV